MGESEVGGPSKSSVPAGAPGGSGWEGHGGGAAMGAPALTAQCSHCSNCGDNVEQKELVFQSSCPSTLSVLLVPNRSQGTRKPGHPLHHGYLPRGQRGGAKGGE